MTDKQAQWFGENYPSTVQLSGGFNLNGVKYLWDYVNKVAVREDDMMKDKERWAASERAKWEVVKEDD